MLAIETEPIIIISSLFYLDEHSLTLDLKCTIILEGYSKN